MAQDETIKRAADVLRIYLKDSPKTNKLLGGQYENDPQALELCIWMALDDWNLTPPLIDTVGLKNHPAKGLLIKKAAIEALTSAMMWHSREHMPSTDGGTSADDHAKIGEYSQIIGGLTREYEMGKLNVKKALNAATAFGEYFSEYFVSGVGYEARGMF